MISAPAVEAGDALSGVREVSIPGRRLLRDRSAPETAQVPPSTSLRSRRHHREAEGEDRVSVRSSPSFARLKLFRLNEKVNAPMFLRFDEK